MASALAAGTGKNASQHQTASARFARLWAGRPPRGWAPAQAGPWQLLFAGHLDNAASLSGALAAPVPAAGDADALARFYGRALLAWGDATDCRLIGEYAVIAVNGSSGLLRLARSPLRAPPLHYCIEPHRAVASTAPRALFACGIPREVDETKLADMAWFNAGEEQRSWFKGIARVPLGSVVEIAQGGPERARRYYDPGRLPRLPKADPRDYLAQADALLAEGTRAALAGSNRPAVMLSGGLDSPLVALKVLELIGPERGLDTYTLIPEPGWNGWAPPDRYGSERPFVEAFCKMHPGLRPHFIDNRDSRCDDRLLAMFHATGSAPQGLANLWTCHAAWDAARRDGCDRVVLGEFGNLTISNDGCWGFGEYLLKLRWGQLALALRHVAADKRPLWRRFVSLAVLPLLPDSLWHWQQRMCGQPDLYARFSPLRPDYAEASGAIARSRAAGLPNPRYPVRDRLALLREVHDNAWGEFSDTYSGFAEIHGMEQRDPMAYRPLVEFCAGLPTEMFLRDGRDRWLARELLKGAMPEEQRLSRKTGRHNADWQVKLGRQRHELLREVERLRENPRLAAMFDLERVQAALEDWPTGDSVPEDVRLVCEIVVPRAINFGRFVNHVEGRN